MSKRSDLIGQLAGQKTTLEIIDELRRLPIEDKELHVIPYSTKVYRIGLFCCDCGYRGDALGEKCNKPNWGKCPPKRVYEGIYMGNDDHDFGTKTFFSRGEAEQFRKPTNL